MIIDVRNQFVLPEGRYSGNQVRLITPATMRGHAVHHSVTQNYGEDASQAQEIAALKAVETYHIDIGYGLFAYHAATFPSGRAYQVGNWNGQRAHVASRNHELTGVVNMGTFTNQMPGEKQMAALREVLLAQRYYWEPAGHYPIRGHNLWALPGNGTECAGAPLNSITEAGWETILSGPNPEEDDMIKRWGGEANPSYWNGREVQGPQGFGARGDFGLPGDAKSVLVEVFLVSGGLTLMDGASNGRAGYVDARHGHPANQILEVLLDADGNCWMFGDNATIDKFVCVGYR